MNFIDTGSKYTELTDIEKLSNVVDLLCEKYYLIEEEKNKYKEQIEQIVKRTETRDNKKQFENFMNSVEELINKFGKNQNELFKYKELDTGYKNPLLTEEIFKEMTDELSNYITKIDNLEKENKKVLELMDKIKKLENINREITKNYNNEHKEKQELTKRNRELIWENDCLSRDYGLDNDFDGFTLDENGMRQIELEKKGRIFNCLDLNQDPYYNSIDSIEKARDFLYLDTFTDKKILKLVFRSLSQYFHPDISAHRGDAKLGEEIFKKLTDANELLKKVSF